MITRLVGMVTLLLCVACGDGEGGSYPPVKLEFASILPGADGLPAQLYTDDGRCHKVVEDRSGVKSTPDSMWRAVVNYETTVDGGNDVVVYAAQVAIAPQPKRAAEFEGGVKYDGAEVLSMWMGRGFLNMVLAVKAQSGKHRFHFVEEWVERDLQGICTLSLRLYHDRGDDVEAYTRRAYLSVPLASYVDGHTTLIRVLFSVFTPEGEWKSYEEAWSPMD